MQFYKFQNYDVDILLSRSQVNNDVKNFINQLNFRYHFLNFGEVNNYNLINKFKISKNFYNFLKIVPIYLKTKPDVIVISTGNPGSFLTLILLPVRFLYILHSYPINGSRFSFKTFFLNLCLNRKKRILTVSSFSRNNIVKYWHLNLKEKYVNYIYNTSSTTDENIIKNYKQVKEKTKLMVLTIGHVRWYKNPELWFYIAQKVLDYFKKRKIEFIWVGAGELLSEFREKAKKTNTNIFFLGYEKNTEKFLNMADIYLQPSLIESHGMSVVDAMQNRLPCVVSNVGGLAETVVNGDTGFVVDINRKEEFVKKIILLLEKEALRKKMGQSGYERYLRNFSYKIWQGEMADLFKEIFN
jgi:glycosyltransferase involved in cell wall biosynthesis